MLLLPRDMNELRNLKKHEVFLSLKRDLALVRFLAPALFLSLLLCHVCVFHTILSLGLIISYYFLIVRLFRHPMSPRNRWIVPWLKSRRRNQGGSRLTRPKLMLRRR